MIHAIQNYPKDLAIKSIISKKTQKIELKKFAVDKLEELGSFEYAHNELEKLFNEILNEIERLGGNPLLNEALKVIVIQLLLMIT